MENTKTKDTQTQPDIRVLVVDDSEFSRKSIVGALEAENIHIVGEAGDAKSAIDLFTSTNPNLLIIDVVMPDISGIELAKYFRENYGEIHIIMISSLAQEQVVLEAILAGANDFLHKPFPKRLLIDSVDKMRSQLKQAS